MGNWDVSKPNNDGERELIDRAVKALEEEFATKTCNNKQVINKLVASEDAISRRAAIDAIRKDVMGGLNYEGILTRLPSVTPKQEPCEDAISRQAAIEEIRFGQSFITKIHPTGEIEHLFDKENKALEAAVERIEALPSVTPKQEPCVWCANIKKLNYRIEYYWVDWVGLPASLDPKCDHFVRREIARFCPNCGRQLESEGNNDKSRD